MDKWCLARKNRYGAGFDVLYSGTQEECEEHIKKNDKYWFNGEEIVVYRISYTAIKTYKATVNYEEKVL